VAQRRNYGFERRRKAEVRQVKQEVKRQRRLERAEAQAVGPEMGEPQDIGPSPDTWEWFSPSRGRTLSVRAGTRPDSDGPDDWIPLTDHATDPDAGSGGASEDAARR
jgi:hypothetical protein